MSTKPNSLYVLRAAECGTEHLFGRGKRATYYVRMRIPSDLLDTCRAGKTELTVSLKTSDERLAKERLHTELAAMDSEFARWRQKLAGVPGQPARQELRVLSPELLDGLAAAWPRSMLQGDEACRQAGLVDGEFEDLGAELASTRADLGALRARGNVSRILRYLTATVLATLLVACSGMSERPANACATPQQCEIEAYSRSR